MKINKQKMSKSNSIKKLNLKDLNTSNNEIQKEKVPIKSISIPKNNKLQIQNDQPGIIEVFEDNFIQEMKNLTTLLEEYNYVGMDTEFPGTVYSVDNMTEDFYYKTLKRNVDKLKLIQLGITVTNEKGEYPKNYPYHTWQFNLEFDKNKEPSHPSSMNLLKQCGIDFDKLKKRGINHKIFAQYFTTSNLVLNPDIIWVSFQGAYDFGYLLKLLIGTNLPEKEEDFIDQLNSFFINYYDIRVLVKGNDNMQKGLNRLAEQFEVKREGKIHQAGSDSVVTIDVFFKLKKSGYVNNSKLEDLKNILYGIGGGRDNDETINYTQIGGINFQNNNNNNNLIYSNLSSIGTNFMNINLNMNMNFYNYPIMLNNRNSTLSPFDENHQGQISALI
jgi:CCR4-NOT transcription complex subunit 7/8